MRLRQGLIKKPVLRTAPGVFEERHATWLELFYDLAFVAAIGQISSALSHEFHWAGVGRFFLLFIPVWWAWVGQTFYLSRFDSDDLIHRLLSLVQIIIVCMIAVNIPRAFAGDTHGFALSYAAIRLVLVAQYVLAGSQVPKARKLTNLYAIGFGSSALLWGLSIFVPQPWMFVVWAFAILLDFSTPFLMPQMSLDIPPDYSHVPERFGLFTIIVLGEAVLAVISGLRIDGLGAHGAEIGVLAIVLAFGLWWIYFDGVKGQQVQIPKQRKDLGRLQVWLYSHMPLTAAIVVAAVGIKHAIPLKASEAMVSNEATIVASAILVVFLSLYLIYWAGIHPKLRKITRMISLPHVLTTTACVPVILLADRMTGFSLVAILTGLSCTQVLWTLRDLPESDELLRRVESAKGQTATSI